MEAIEGVLWVLFTLICIVVSGVILLQEGKGGGLGEAFGGAGAQTFGVKAGGIVKFTGYLAAGLVVLALVITKIRSTDTVISGAVEPAPTVPVSAPLDTSPADAVSVPVEQEGG